MRISTGSREVFGEIPVYKPRRGSQETLGISFQTVWIVRAPERLIVERDSQELQVKAGRKTRHDWYCQVAYNIDGVTQHGWALVSEVELESLPVIELRFSPYLLLLSVMLGIVLGMSCYLVLFLFS